MLRLALRCPQGFGSARDSGYTAYHWECSTSIEQIASYCNNSTASAVLSTGFTGVTPFSNC